VRRRRPDDPRVREAELVGDPLDAGLERLREAVLHELPERRVVLEDLELRHTTRTAAEDK